MDKWEKRFMAKDKWDKRFMDMADLVSTWSKDPDNKVGAVLVKDRKVLSTGYNGLPANVERCTHHTKVAKTVHAEVNCIIQAPSPGQVIYITRFPCSQCAALIVQTGIFRVVCRDMEPESSWYTSMIVASEILAEASVLLELF